MRRSLKIFWALLAALGLIAYMGSNSALMASHVTHFVSDKGPHLPQNESGCTTCHDEGYRQCGEDGPFFQPGENAEDQNGDGKFSLYETNICDPCHSKGGAYDGVQLAKENWDGGVYNEPGDSLLVEDWCATCHDDEPANSKADGLGIAAPNVMGDNVAYGYNVTGHGRDSAGLKCEDCHDLTLAHIDHNHRTYEVDDRLGFPLQVIHPYTESYRLNKPLIVPRQAQSNDDGAFELCTSSCHDYDALTSDNSNFRGAFLSSRCGTAQNWHGYHLIPDHEYKCGDSDFDGTVDSSQTCILCHNVHGSPMEIDGNLEPNPVMIRHGELIDKSPAFDFKWYKGNCNTAGTVGAETASFEYSRWGSMQCGDQSGTLSYNNVCFGCHLKGEIKYYRQPVGLVDDFEEYTSHDSLRLTWRRGKDAYRPYLAVSGGPDGSNCMAMNVSWALDPADIGYEWRALDPIDLTDMEYVSFYVKVTDTSKIQSIKVVLRRTQDYAWSVSSPYSTSGLQNGVWQLVSFPKDSFNLDFGEVNGIAVVALEYDPDQSYAVWVLFDDIRFVMPGP